MAVKRSTRHQLDEADAQLDQVVEPLNGRDQGAFAVKVPACSS
jgi:hypothetical protein